MYRILVCNKKFPLIGNVLLVYQPGHVNDNFDTIAQNTGHVAIIWLLVYRDLALFSYTIQDQRTHQAVHLVPIITSQLLRFIAELKLMISVNVLSTLVELQMTATTDRMSGFTVKV